jgi:hypothetical protein
VVRLGGYRSQHANTVDVLAAAQRVTLLVVAPGVSAPTAHAVLIAAGRRGNTDDVDSLLRSLPIAGEVVAGTDGQWEAALQRWEVDDGRVIVADAKVCHNGRWADSNVDRPRKPQF